MAHECSWMCITTFMDAQFPFIAHGWSQLSTAGGGSRAFVASQVWIRSEALFPGFTLLTPVAQASPQSSPPHSSLPSQQISHLLDLEWTLPLNCPLDHQEPCQVCQSWCPSSAAGTGSTSPAFFSSVPGLPHVPAHPSSWSQTVPSNHLSFTPLRTSLG